MTKEQIERVWKLAMTYAHNICAQISDEYNNDDYTSEADAVNKCCKRIKGEIEDVHPDVYNLLSK